MRSKRQFRVSIAIVTRNREAFLRACLTSLTKQIEVPYEVCVIDNASEDNTKECINSFKEKLPIRYRYEKKIGIPYGRNAALNAVKGDIIAFIDDDCIASTDWVEKINLYHQKYLSAAAIQGKSVVINPKSIISYLTDIFHKRYIQANFLSGKKLLIIDTKNVSFKISRLQKNNLSFDEAFLRGQDVDIAKQLLDLNESIYYEERIKIFFRARSNVYRFLYQRFLIGFFNTKLKYKWFYTQKLWPERTTKKTYSKKIKVKIYRYLASKAYEIGELLAKIQFFYDITRLEKTALKEKKENHKSVSISVVIITKNQYESLRKCLLSLKKQTHRPTQVIIVDASKDNRMSKTILAFFKDSFSITYIHSQKSGYAIQRNLGIKAAVCDIIAMISDDAIAKNTWCEEVHKAHLFHSEPVIQGRIISTDVNKNYIAAFHQIRMDLWFLKNLDGKNRIGILATKNVSFKRAIFTNYTLSFLEDPRYNTFGGEDVDLGYVIQYILGKNILYNPEICVFHTEKTSISYFLSDRFYKGCASMMLSLLWMRQRKNIYEKGYLTSFLSLFFFLFHPVYKQVKKNLLGFIFLAVLNKYYYERGVKYIKTIAKIKNVPFIIPRRITIQSRKSSLIEIGIVTKDRDIFLHHLLASLTHQTILPKTIIIVDSSINNESKQIVDYFKTIIPIKYIHSSTSNIANSRNIILENASSLYLAFVDDDCIVAQNWIEILLTYHIKRPSYIAIQGYARSIPVSVYSYIKQYERYYWIFTNINLTWEKYIKIFSGKKERSFPFYTADTRNISFVLPMLKNLQIQFDTSLERGSDTDFGNKLISLNQKILFTPQIWVDHIERQTIKNFLIQNYNRGYAWLFLSDRYKGKYKKLNFSFSLVKHFFVVCKNDDISLIKTLYYLAIYVAYESSIQIGYRIAFLGTNNVKLQDKRVQEDTQYR